MANLKNPTTFQQQVECFEEKNIIVADKEACTAFLKKVNYYRLSAYHLPFKTEDGKCQPNVTFEQIQKIYEFDKELRMLILGMIEDIEINLRTQIAYYSAHKYGSDGYMIEKNYNKKHNHNNFEKHLSSCIRENSNTLIVKHHISKYNGKFPIWVIIEFFSIGMLSHFYRDMKTTDRKKISKELYNTSHFVLDSWMRCLTDLRNKCAHYSRLYYTIFPAIPKMPINEKYIPTRKLFAQLYMLKLMHPSADVWNNNFLKPLIKLFKKYSLYISREHLDFPYRWKSMLKK